MRPVKAGNLRHVITIQQPVSSSRDDYGQKIETWTDVYADIRAAIWPMTGKEFLASQVISSKIDTRIRIRYQAGILAKWRVVWGSRIFEISRVEQPDMRTVFLDLMCYEIHVGPTRPAPTGA